MQLTAASRPIDVALGGGGVRGIGLVGALIGLDEAGYRVVRVLGTSAGAVVGAFAAALVQAGEPMTRLTELMGLFSDKRLADRWPVGHVPVVGEPLSLLFDRSLYEGRYLRDFVTSQLAKLGVRSFGDLRLPGEDVAPVAGLPEASVAYRFAATATDLTLRRGVVVPWDLADYGLDPALFSVADAVVASAAIPFVFPPLRIPGGHGSSVLVDGGVLDDLPIETLDATKPSPPPRPTVAVSLGGRVTKPGKAPVSIVAEGLALVETLLAGGESRYLGEPCTAARVISVDTLGISPVDFAVTAAQQQQLFQAGKDAAHRFVEAWDFEAWLARCGGQVGSAPVSVAVSGKS